MSEWQPSPVDRYLGQEAYMRYLNGINMLNRPYSPVTEGLLACTADEHLEGAILGAERLMYNGIRAVISFANPVDTRHDKKAMEPLFEEAVPHMIAIVEETYDKCGSRIEKLNPAYTTLQPAPFYDQPVYHHLCHGNRHRLSTLRLMDGIQPAPIYMPLLRERRLAGGLAIKQAAS